MKKKASNELSRKKSKVFHYPEYFDKSKKIKIKMRGKWRKFPQKSTLVSKVLLLLGVENTHYTNLKIIQIIQETSSVTYIYTLKLVHPWDEKLQVLMDFFSLVFFLLLNAGNIERNKRSFLMFSFFVSFSRHRFLV